MPEIATEGVSDAQAAGVWLLQGAGIALTANLVNLTDLRPGRALKSFALLAVIGSFVVGLNWDWMVGAYFGVILLGPVVAVWGLDLKERGMLGDGGANAAGALAGWVMVMALQPWWWALAIYVALVLALNLVSERVSFSAIIESNAALRWLDGLGRIPEALREDSGGQAGRPDSKGGKTRPHGERRDR